MKKCLILWGVFIGVIACTPYSFSQPANSPEEAGIKPVTGDWAPWREYGVDAFNFDSVWIIALNNGNIVAFKRSSEMQQPGVVGGTEFLMFAADGTQLTALPVKGNFTSSGDPFPNGDFASTGESWGFFTLGAHADRANGTGFVVHNQGDAFQTFGLEFADVVADEEFSMIQLFDNNGAPVGTTINAFGSLTAEPGEYRDVGAIILSNGDIVVLGEDRQVTDPLLDAVGADASSVAIAVILAPDGSIRKEPFVVHTDDQNIYLGGSSSVVFQNMIAFEGGFVIDYDAGIRWYNNDGTPRTPVQPDHAELTDVDASPDIGGFIIGSDSGGRGDSMALASNGKDLVVKSLKVGNDQEAIGVLVYYNTDGTVRNWVRFDDVDQNLDVAMVDRTFCDMDENGNVFVVWQDNRFGGDINEDHSQVFGRFFNAEGEPFGPSFPVYENWKSEPAYIDFGGSIGNVPMGDIEQPRCAMNNQVAAVISASTLLEDIDDMAKQLSSAFDLILNEPLIRLFENPYAGQADVNEWALY